MGDPAGAAVCHAMGHAPDERRAIGTPADLGDRWRDLGRAFGLCDLLSTRLLPVEPRANPARVGGWDVFSRRLFGGDAGRSGLLPARENLSRGDRRFVRHGRPHRVVSGPPCQFYQRRTLGPPDRYAVGRGLSR